MEQSDGASATKPGANQGEDPPTPGVPRRSSMVQFTTDTASGHAHRTTDESYPRTPGSPIATISERNDTHRSKASRASSKLEPQWRKQAVLSFDGGGIRGYSSLLILREIMKAIGEIERDKDPSADSSFHPGEYHPNYDRTRPSGPPTRQNTKQGSDPAVSPPNGNSSPEAESNSETSPCQYLPCHYWDYIGGTSTGGLIAIMLGRLRMGVDECLEEYRRFGGDIFAHPRWFSIRGPIPWFQEKYDGRRLQDAVERVVERRLSPSQKRVGAGSFGAVKDLCKTVVFAYQWNVDAKSQGYGDEEAARVNPGESLVQESPVSPGAYLFRSYDHWGRGEIHERNPGPAHNIPIWQVARATTAAPTYFDPIAIQNCTFGDGGLGSNNPAKELFFEVARMNGNNTEVIDSLVSIGTGEADPPKFANSGFAKFAAYLSTVKALALDSQKKHMEMMELKSTNNEELGYYRFNLPKEQGLRNMKLDEWKEEGKQRPTRKGTWKRKEGTIGKITRLTRDYCQRPEIKKEIETIAERLVDHRRSRCHDERKWELWSTGVRYRCTVKNCDKSQKLRGSKQDLVDHIRKVHGFSDETQKENEEVKGYITKGTCHY